MSFSTDLPNLAIRVKNSSGAVTSLYRNSSAATYYDGTNAVISPNTSSTSIVYVFGQASSLRDFVHTFTNVPTTTFPDVWVSTGTMGAQYASGTAYGVVNAGGVVNAQGALTGVQLFPTSVSTFTGGTITVICEG